MDVEKLKVTELKNALLERGLDTKGNKSALVDRLQAAINESDDCNDRVNPNPESRDVSREKEITNDDVYNPEEETPSSPENGEHSRNGDNDETQEEGGFENQEFVRSKPSGISFGLHEPTKVKPQPKELQPLTTEDQESAEADGKNQLRTGASSFFNGGQNGKEAAVPLPPTTSFMEESEDEDEDGPPGLGNVELPSNIFKPAISTTPEEKPKVPESENINWRSYEVEPVAVPEADWSASKYLQSPAVFLQEEAEMAGEELVYEVEDNDVPGLSPTSVKIQLTYFDTTVSASGDSEQEAMHNVALEMLKESGPWISESIYEEVTNSIVACLPMSLNSWAPPRYNLSHVSMLDNEGATFVGEQPGKKLYKAEVLLGPVKCTASLDNPKEAVQAMGNHLKSFLSTRNLIALNESSPEELEQMGKKYFYVGGPGIVSVFMEGEGKAVVLPALDIFNLQKKLKDGKFPSNYGAKDEYGCCKVFMSDLCSTRIAGPDAGEALKVHVESDRHQRRLGRFFFKNVLIETFRPGASPLIPKNDPEEDAAELEKYCIKMCSSCAEDGVQVVAVGFCVDCQDYLCESCVDAHKKTKLTKNHTINDVSPPIINHPRKDAAEGREVKKDSEGYLVRIYRCGTIKGKGVKEGGDSRWGPAPGAMMGPGGPGMMGPGGMIGTMPPAGWGHPGMMGHGGPMMGPGGPRPPGPGFGPPGGQGGPPGTPGAPTPGQEEAPVKSGLVNDPMANIGGQGPPGGAPGQPPYPGGPPGQWGPWGGPGGPQGGPGGWGGPPGPWGPRPPGPPGMICVSQGVSGKMCKHFTQGRCTYGNRCIHLHLVPNPQAQAMNQQAQAGANPEGEESDDEDDEEEEEEGEGEAKPAPSAQVAGASGPGPGPMGMPMQPQKSMFEKREEAKSRAFEEAMAAAKAAAAKTGDLSSHLVTGRGGGGGGRGELSGVNVIGPSIMHAYSVGQKSKKKDPKPEEQRPGDWQCECGNYNFAWRKECNACGKKKPVNELEEEAKQSELARIKAEREKRRAEARGGAGGRDGRGGDLRNRIGGDRRDNRDRDRGDRDRDRDRGDRDRDRDRDRGDRDRDRGRDRDRDERSSTRDSRDGRRAGGKDDFGNANMVPIANDRRGGKDSDDRSRDRDNYRESGDRSRDRDRDSERSRDRDRDSERSRDRDSYREKEKSSKEKKREKSRDRDREDSYHKEKKEKKRKRSKEYDYDDDEYESHGSGKKHKKSHKSSKDEEEGRGEKKKKKKEKDRSREREKEERRKHRRSQEEEGEIPGDWGEWYDQARRHSEHDDRGRY